MNEPSHHTASMKRKQRLLGLLVVGLVGVMFVVYREWLGRGGIPLAWAALIAGAIAANRILSCPVCGKRLGSIFQKACSHCGARLADQPLIISATDRPTEAGALEYMAESRRMLRRWAGVRRMLGRSVYVVGVAAAAVTMTLGLRNSSPAEAIGVGLFVGVVAAAAAWLILVHVIDNAVGMGFLFLRGRCPVCRTWFNPPASFGPGSIHMDYSLPQFCASCSARLG